MFLFKEHKDESNLKLYARVFDVPARTLKKAMLKAIATNRLLTAMDLPKAVRAMDLLPVSEPDTLSTHLISDLISDIKSVKDVDTLLNNKKTILRLIICEVVDFSTEVGGIIASFIYPESHEATKFNIEFMGARNSEVRSKYHEINNGLWVSWLYAWQANKQDYRDKTSTLVCVKDKYSLTPKNKENAMWRLLPAGVDENGVEAFWIQQVGSRGPGKKSGGYLHVWEYTKNCHRDNMSTRLCVHDQVYDIRSLFRIVGKDESCRIQMVGRRKKGARKGPTLHVWDCKYRDPRDDFSTFVCVHDKFQHSNSLWRLSVAKCDTK